MKTVYDFIVKDRAGNDVSLPFMGCAWWIISLFVVLLIVGYLYLKIVDILKRFKNRNPS